MCLPNMISSKGKGVVNKREVYDQVPLNPQQCPAAEILD